MNTIVIEQNQDETKLAFEVNLNAAISRIRLARAKVASQVSEQGTPSPIVVMFNFKSKPVSAPTGVLRLEIAFRMTGFREKSEGKKVALAKSRERRKEEPAVLVECAYEVDYVLREGASVTPEHVKAFKDGNAIFNAWPYFREYLQNNLQRMGLPPLTAPFLRLQPKPKPKPGEQAKLEGDDQRSLPGHGSAGKMRKARRST